MDGPKEMKNSGSIDLIVKLTHDTHLTPYGASSSGAQQQDFQHVRMSDAGFQYTQQHYEEELAFR
jgi:hypothetical protein